MARRNFFVAVAVSLLFGFKGYAPCDDLFPVEPSRFFSSDWMMWWDYPKRSNGWAQLDTTLRDAGCTWTQPYWEWGVIERTPSGAAEDGIVHNYDAANLTLLSVEVTYLKALDYRIAIVIDPSMGLWRWSRVWAAKVRAGDADAQQAFYETMKKLATDFRGRIDAWQIDQESGDASAGGYNDPQAFARLLRAGYRGIKAGDPDAFVFWSDAVYHGWIGKVLTYLAENYADEELFPFTDGMAPHLFRTRGPDHDEGYRPRTSAFTGTLADALTLYHLVGRDYGVSWENTTPVGMVQTPYSTYGASARDINNNVVTFEQQANYRVRKAVIELTLGYVWAGWSEHLADWGNYSNDWTAYWGNAGIIKNEGDSNGVPDDVPPDPPYREKEAWWALNALGGNFTAEGLKRAGILKGARFLSRLRLDGDNQHGYRFLKPDGTMVTVIWDANPALEPLGRSTVTLKSRGEVDVISRDGDFLFTQSGSFELDIGPAPQYIIGTLVEPSWAAVRKISNDGRPAVWGYSDAYVIDIQTEAPATRIAVTVPQGWTLPQTTDGARAGYVTIEPGPSVPSPTSVRASGGAISISFDPHAPAPAGGVVRIYYGDVRGQSILLDAGLNGVLADYAAPNWTPQFLAPPDHAYHKLARNSVYTDYLGYGFDREGAGAVYSGRTPRDSIFADGCYLSNGDGNAPWILKAKANAASFHVKVYREDPTAGANDDYLRGQRVTIAGNGPPAYQTDSVVMFSDVIPQDGLISVSVTPARNPSTGEWVRMFYGVDIWPSELGAGPGRGAVPGENQFVVQMAESSGDSIPVAPLSPGALNVTVVGPTGSPPVACWLMDEGAGAKTSDTAGNVSDGTISGAAWTTGKVGRCLSFDGSDDHVTFPDAKGLDIRPAITVMAYVYPTFDTWPEDCCVQSKGDAYKMLCFKDGKLYAALHDGTDWRTVYSQSLLALDRWSHVASTFDGSTLKLYVNGSEVAAGVPTGWGGNMNVSDQDLMIGAFDSLGTRKGFFKGKIDVVKIYDRALSAKEIEWEQLRGMRTKPPL